MRKISRFFCHVSVVLSLMFIVFLVIDHYNSAMQFIDSDLSKALLMVFAICSLVNAYTLIAQSLRRERDEEAQEQAEEIRSANVSEQPIKFHGGGHSG